MFIAVLFIIKEIRNNPSITSDPFANARFATWNSGSLIKWKVRLLVKTGHNLRNDV